jgi:hypothetical protein
LIIFAMKILFDNVKHRVYPKLNYKTASNPKPQKMNNQLSNKTPQATYSGDTVGGSVVRGMLGAFCF